MGTRIRFLMLENKQFRESLEKRDNAAKGLTQAQNSPPEPNQDFIQQYNQILQERNKYREEFFNLMRPYQDLVKKCEEYEQYGEQEKMSARQG